MPSWLELGVQNTLDFEPLFLLPLPCYLLGLIFVQFWLAPKPKYPLVLVMSLCQSAIATTVLHSNYLTTQWHTPKRFIFHRHLCVSWASSVLGWAPWAWLQSGGLRSTPLLLSLIITGSAANQRRFFLDKRKTSPTSQVHLNSLLCPSANISLARTSHVAKLKVRNKEEYSAYSMGGENDYILNNNQYYQTLDEPYEEDTTG